MNNKLSALGKIGRISLLFIFVSLTPTISIHGLDETILYVSEKKISAETFSRIRTGNYTYLNFYSSGLSDSDLAKMPCAHVKILFLNGTGVSNNGIRSLVRCEALHELYIGRTKISDGIFEILKMLPNLRGLDVSGARISNFSGIASLTNLEAINLGNLGLDNRIYSSLKGLKKLKDLSLSNNNISRFSKNLTQLRHMSYAHTAISDYSYKTLENYEKLESLDVSHTMTTVQALDRIKKLNKLKILFLTGTKITKEGCLKITSAIPNTEVHCSY